MKNRLKELREAKGLTVRQLAEELGVESYSTISRYELGKSTGMKYDFIMQLCDYFNVTPNYLLGYEESSADELRKHYEAKIAELEAEFDRRFNAFAKSSERTIDFISDLVEKSEKENHLLKDIVLKQSILIGGKAGEFTEKKKSQQQREDKLVK